MAWVVPIILLLLPTYAYSFALPQESTPSPGAITRSPTFERQGATQSFAKNSFSYPAFSNPEAATFLVNTSMLPNFNGLDVQNSWAGRIGGDDANFFFWYFPSSKLNGSTKLAVWLNGGPGCSSMEGIMEENGPFRLGVNSTVPALNEHAFTAYADMLYVDNPVGVGFSQGSAANLTGELPLADSFYEWLVEFFTVFPELTAKDFYMTGESYAGMYIPYIANRILTASEAEKSATPINLKGLMINDGVYNSFITSQQAPVARFSNQNAATLGFNDTVLAYFNATSSDCGYETLMNAVTYPQPAGAIPLPNPTSEACDLFDLFYDLAVTNNPCFNIYRITDVCPTPVDQMATYFGMSEVQTALHVLESGSTPFNWTECNSDSPFVNGIDLAPFTDMLLPFILSHIPVLLSHGMIDSVLFTAGDLITIQNMTWGGTQGFTVDPTLTPLTLDNQVSGTWHTERNLTFLTINNAGHMVPQDQPALELAIFASFLESGSVGSGALSSVSINTTAVSANAFSSSSGQPSAKGTGTAGTTILPGRGEVLRTPALLGFMLLAVSVALFVVF